MFIDTVFKILSIWIYTGEKQFYLFLNTAEIPLNKPIKKNSFLFPGKCEDQNSLTKRTSHIQMIL